MRNPKNISGRVKRIKEHFAWNNVQLAQEAGVTRQAVGEWVNKDVSPSQEALIRLRTRHCISDIWLLSGKGNILTSPPRAKDSLDHRASKLSPEDRAFFLRQLELLEGSDDKS